MTDLELRDELITLLTAGHETSATALAWSVERLLRNPQVLGRLQSDLGDDDYIEAVVKETLRVRPVVIDVARIAKRDLEIGGRRIPAGTIVVPAIALVQLRPDLYPEPRAFRPERFLGEEQPPAYSWIPFGGGVRRCIGAAFAQLEIKTVLRTVLASARPERARPGARAPAEPARDPGPARGTRWCRWTSVWPFRTTKMHSSCPVGLETYPRVSIILPARRALGRGDRNHWSALHSLPGVPSDGLRRHRLPGREAVPTLRDGHVRAAGLPVPRTAPRQRPAARRRRGPAGTATAAPGFAAFRSPQCRRVTTP